MMKKFRTLRCILILTGSYMLGGCAAVVIGGAAAGATSGAAVATDPRSSGVVFDDQSLKNKVADSLHAMIPGNSIEVTSYNQNILLTGQVINEENKTKAVEVTKQVVGVKKIYNYIQVGATQSASQTSKDAYLTSAVKSNLLVTKGIDSNRVKVVTTDGVVYLMGLVNQDQSKKMEAAASQVDGVKKVIGIFEDK
jgi:osmotically-inducible protein OsmY